MHWLRFRCKNKNKKAFVIKKWCEKNQGSFPSRYLNSSKTNEMKERERLKKNLWTTNQPEIDVQSPGLLFQNLKFQGLDFRLSESSILQTNWFWILWVWFPNLFVYHTWRSHWRKLLLSFTMYPVTAGRKKPRKCFKLKVIKYG